MDYPTRASVVIVSKNRKDELRGAIASCLGQTVPVEVIVIDDGSTDGTAEMVAAEFSQIRFTRFEQSEGYIGRRNLGARMATAPIVFSLDDDAIFASPKTVEQTLREFDHPRIAAIAIPYIDVNYPPKPLNLPPDGERILVGSYTGLAHAVRRDIFLHLCGYREFLFHQGEELDYCIRLMSAGYVVRAGRGDPVHHFESPKRDRARQFVYGARNTLLRAWYYAPLMYLPIHLLGAMINLYRFAIKRRHPIWITRGIFTGFLAIWQQRHERRPLSVRTHALVRYITRKDRVSLEEFETRLPQLTGTAPQPGGQCG